MCQMFSDTSKSLSIAPPLPPIPILFEDYKTELPNFNCYLPNPSKSSSKRNKRQVSSMNDNGTILSDTLNATDSRTEKLVLLLDPNKEAERIQNYEAAKRKFQSDFGGLDLSISYPYFFELLWYSQLPCSDVETLTSGYKDEKSFIKRCFWEEIEIECHSIFQMRTTDRGMCCSFNTESLDKTLRAGNFSKVVKNLQNQDDALAFDNTGYNSSKSIKNVMPLRGKPGHGKGLMVFLDAHTDRISSGTIFDEFMGFATVVDGPDQFPMTYQKSFLIQPGYENSVALSAVDIRSMDGIRSIQPNQRGCYFSDESPLKLHHTYSHSNCLLECSLDYTFDSMSKSNQSNQECIPWFYPVKEINMGFCDPWQTKEFLRIMAEIPDGTCSQCLPDCDTTMYDASVSTAPIRFCDHTNLGSSNLCTMDSNALSMNPSLLSEPIKNEFWKSNNGTLPDFATPTVKNLPSKRLYINSGLKEQHLVFKRALQKQPDYDAFKKDIALVNFYFEQPYVQQYKRQHSLTIQDFIAQVGGLFSLAVGMSIVSVFELIWHFMLHPMIKTFKKAFALRALQN